MTSVIPFKRENQRSNLYKKQTKKHLWTRHQQTTTTEHQVPDLRQVQINAAGLNVLKGTNIFSLLSLYSYS